MPQHPRRIRENQPTTAHDRSGASAALAAALDVIGDRWTLLLVNALMNGPRRFGELQDEVPDIAANILTQRLRRLERDALVVARPYSTRPLRMVYELTAAGAELADVLTLLASWGARRAGAEATGPRHSVCGSALEARWWCPTCREPVEESTDEELHFL